MEPASDPFLARLHLYVDPKEQLLICGECGYALAVERSQATSHLRDKHRINQGDRRGLTKHLNARYPQGFRNPAGVPLRADGSEIHPRLRVHEGFACYSYRTVNYHELTKHISQKHLGGRQATSARIGNLYDDVYLQTWTHGASRRYWIVKKNGSTIRPSARQRERARAEEQERTQSTNTIAPTLAGTRPWMERTRWEITYQGFRRDILRSLTEMPWGSPWIDHVLGPSSNPTDLGLVSPQDDEAKIALLIVAVDHVLDRCEETMQHTGRTILCWLRSTKPQTCYPKPFTLVALKSSKKKYRQLLKRFFAFTFCAYRMPVDVRRRLTGIRFKKEQLHQMRAIWEHRAWSNDLAQGKWPGSRDGDENSGGGAEVEGGDEGDDEGEGIDEGDEYEVEEGEDDENDEDTEGGVKGEREDVDDGDGKLVFQLSITFSTEEFVDSQPSSSLLRLLFLEYALLLRPYPHLGIPRRSRFQQHQHFDVIRQSDDGETVSYGDDFSLTIESFRGLAEHFLIKAEELCDDLMFGLHPEIDLAKYPANKLADTYLDLSAKACTTRRNGLFRENRWDWKAISIYRKKAESLLEMIAGVLQTVGGQVARVSELFSLEYQNGSSTERGFYYLVYIRRFLEMLRREQSSCPDRSVSFLLRNLLFRSDQSPGKPWDSSRFTSILKKATTEVWKISTNS
ncbi:hypothetical protein BKA61DRAFT_717673 [Leptodontidium sp. MPI-SDFR-AT-0119]|nr:hypothetical protein BKA61DRAFT_717673 [Leptodontidium sp. MPI-SDFR-AT-0119]